MQWVKYPYTRQLGRGVKDMVSKDGIRMLYKGLIPTLNAQIFLYVSVELARRAVVEKNNDLAKYLWPFLFFKGCLFAHP